MRIHVHEHITGGGLAGAPLPPSLRAEGGAMHRAICADLAELDGVKVVTSLDARVDDTLPEGVVVTRVENETNARAVFDRLARDSDASILIAPESGGALFDLTRRALALGARVLGAEPEAVTLAGDKLALARHLEAHGIPHVPAAPLDSGASPPWPPPWVVKPRFGAGCEDTVRVTAEPELPRENADSIVTPLTPGLAASVLLIAGASETIALAPCEQHIGADPRLSYLGGRAPLPSALGGRARDLAITTTRAVPGLRGFVGVDLLLGPDGDRVVEVNPRLTTSYVGLRALAEENLASLALALFADEPARPPRWRDAQVEFDAAGRVDLREADRV